MSYFEWLMMGPEGYESFTMVFDVVMSVAFAILFYLILSRRRTNRG